MLDSRRTHENEEGTRGLGGPLSMLELLLHSRPLL